MLLSLILLGALATFSTSAGSDDFFNEDFDAPNWVKCKPGEKFNEAARLDKKWYKEKEKRGWYYVMGNKWFIITMTKALTGSRPESLEFIKKACFTNQRTDTGFLISGYGKKADYSCKKEESGIRMECTPTHGSTDEKWASNRGTTESTIVWTDNHKYVLGVRCAGMHKTWSLRSTENKPVDAATKKTVFKVIEKMEFKPEYAVAIPRAGCPLLKPLVPIPTRPPA